MGTPEHFDAIIVGSGFGGSVTAYRLAEAGKRVCVLERGQAYAPGSFPRVLENVRNNFWDPSQGLYGMYNVWFFRRLGSLVSSGLGGGSLIYANVMLRKEPRWFVTEDFVRGGYREWPVTREKLDHHYDEVAKMLGVAPFPDSYSVEKVNAFRAAARRVAQRQHGLELIKPELAITFQNGSAEPRPNEVFTDPVPNYHGAERRTCTLCGECVVGCNTGAKNTLDHTYLSAARHHGADIRTLHEVREFRPRGQTIEVDYVVHDRDAKRRCDVRTMTCSRLIVAAGTHGSSYLMLKNADNFGIDRRHVGTRFSGNGDLLSFALYCRDRIEATRGPTITTALRQVDRLETGRAGDGPGFYVEDAGFPKELAWLAEGFNLGGWIKRGVRFAREFVRRNLGADSDTDIATELRDLLGTATLSSHMLPLLAMGRDVPDGRFYLDGDRLQLDWSRDRSAEYFDRVEATARAITEELGGTYLRHLPTYVFGRAVTVHPLGGCPMGRTAEEGVVDGFGKSFAHDRLYVLDGSIMPGPVGPNPAFTIAAIANRAADAMLRA